MIKDEILKRLPLPFAALLTESNDEIRHAHEFFECFYITEGTIEHICANRKDIFSVGDAGLICPNVFHAFKRTNTCIHRDLLISSEFMKKMCDFVDPELYHEITEKQFIKFKMEADDVLSYERQVAVFFDYYDVRYRHMQEKFLLSAILNHVLFSRVEEKRPLNDFRSRCIFVINTSFSHPDAMEKITREMSFNQSYLCKKFKATFGVTITDYINDLRMKHAAFLLQTTNYTQQKICESIGIDSLSYFNRLFKKQYGLTPSKYRKHFPQND